MKLITKIQSFSDVITNSSSTVFLMYETDAKYWEEETPNDMCDITEITHQWLLDNHWEWELIFDFLNLDKNLISYEKEGYYRNYWDDPDSETWQMWVDDNIELLKEKVIGLYYVEIEDHFEDAYELIESATDDALISDYRH